MRTNADHRVWLKDIIESINLIETYLAGLSKEVFFEVSETQDAVAMRLTIIGEAVKNLPQEFKKTHPEIPWGKAAGMRNILIHEYFDIDDNLVWKTLTESLPEFKKQITTLLKKD